MFPAAVAVALGPLLIGFLVGVLFGALSFVVCERVLHADRFICSLVGVIVFVLLFVTISGIG